MFMSAKQLGLETPEYEALKKTLDMLESDGISHSYLGPPNEKDGLVFNMAAWHNSYGCGSVCCIGGTAEMVGQLERYSLDTKAKNNRQLRELFYPLNQSIDFGKITTEQAAAALRNYLITGKPNWECALS